MFSFFLLYMCVCVSWLVLLATFDFSCILYNKLFGLSDYSVGKFYEDARGKTEEILSRGRVPLVTGGTGLYLRWYVPSILLIGFHNSQH